MSRLFIFLTLCCFVCKAQAQTTFYQNGVQFTPIEQVVYTHAQIWVDENTTFKQASILVEGGKIKAVGENLKIPTGAKVINCKGKFIYPAFIDLYSQYGIKTAQEVNPSKTAGEQFNSNKPGAYSWNEALKPEFKAVNVFQPNLAEATTLSKAGFGAVLTGTHDGICRGYTALVSTQPGNAHQSILAKDVTASFSLDKGTSRQPYPSSLMGCMALIRQTYYDAEWYSRQNTETNLSLEAFANLRKLPAIFSTNDKQDVLRAAGLAAEFKANYLIKTGGNDYQLANEIAQTKTRLIVPVNYPKPYQIESEEAADYISTTDLKHWEMAPANLYFLHTKKVPFCITYNGCSNPDEFWKNVRLAIQYGLPETEALKALTTNPAQFINQSLLGNLRPGSWANFNVFSAEIFKVNAILTHQVVQGNLVELYNGPSLKFATQYAYQGKKAINTEQHLFYLPDTFTIKLSIKWPEIVSEQTAKGPAFFGKIIAVDSTVFPYVITNFEGSLVGATNQLLPNLYEILNDKEAEAPPQKTILNDSLIWYPFTDYGQHQQPQAQKVCIKNATIWTNESQGIMQQTDVIIDAGKIIQVGKQLVCNNCTTIDATNMHLTNGIIDEHSHIAITHGVNEGTQAVTSEVRIGDALNAEDINVYRQLAGGVIGAQLLHGSANPIGGQSAIIKLRWGLTNQEIKFKEAPPFIKFALGENVKQANWGDGATTRYPQTRMGVEQVFVDAFTRARLYANNTQPFKRKDLELEALNEILNGKRFITCHSYVQSEINMLMHVADTFGFKVNTFTHILEGYKVADKMKKHGANASTFADWWAYKYEVMDAIPFNAALMHKAGINVAINSDDAEMGRRLNQEAAKIVKYGGVTEEEAWKMVTLNPAKMLHVDGFTGSIKAGKDADLVVWNNNPLSIYAKPLYTFVDGVLRYSVADDDYKRKQIAETRKRILTAMKQPAMQNQAVPHISKQNPNYHCND